VLVPLMLPALCQTAPAALAQQPITYRPALPALAAKAPGKPEYGLYITSPQGQFVFTNLSYSPGTPKGSAALFRVTGPGGLGPYRLGAELEFWFDSYRFREDDPQKTRTYTFPRFEILKVMDAGAAKEAGLDKGWALLKVDGQDFGWDTTALMAYLSNHPTVEALAYKRNGERTESRSIQIRLHKEDLVVNPAEEQLIPEQAKVLQPHLKDPRLWSELIALRSALPRFTPLPMDLGSKRMWAVRGVKDSQPTQGEQSGPITLELWSEDPASRPTQPYPAALWVEPEDGLREGRVLRAEERWYQIQEVAVDADSGRLLNLALKPWTPDVSGLLVGASPAQALGHGATLASREALEEYANDAMVEWKIRSLPGRLTTQGLEGTEDLVIRIEKGLLKLDLEVKGIRSRLDAAARAEAERKAQAELAARDGKASPQVQATPVTESERLADLLDQRKAILMAILGSAKQSLSNQRR